MSKPVSDRKWSTAACLIGGLITVVGFLTVVGCGGSA
jgi:hypothetical protein